MYAQTNVCVPKYALCAKQAQNCYMHNAQLILHAHVMFTNAPRVPIMPNNAAHTNNVPKLLYPQIMAKTAV